MKKLTSTSLILTLALLFSTQSSIAGTLGDKDMAFAFGSGSSMDMAMLSEQEMVETEGEVLPWLAYLGIAAVIRLAAPYVGRYLINNATTGAGTSLGATILNGNDNYAESLSAGALYGPIGGVFGPIGAGAAGAAASNSISSGNSIPQLGGNTNTSTNGSSNFGRDIGSFCSYCNIPN